MSNKPAFTAIVTITILCAVARAQQTPQVTVRLKATLAGHTKSIERIAFSPDGKLITTSSEDHTVRVSDAETGELKEILSGAERAKWEEARWYFNTQYLVTHEFPDVFTGQLKAHLDGGARRLAISPDKQKILVTKQQNTGRSFTRKETLELWAVGTGQLQLTFAELPYGISSVQWSPDGKSIVVEFSGRTKARLVDALTGHVKAKLPYETCGSDHWIFESFDCGGFYFNADGSVFLKSTKPIKLWSADTGQLIAELKPAGLPATFSPSAKDLLVTTGKDKKTALLWEIVSK